MYLSDGKVVMADRDVIIVTTENVQMLHVDFTAPSARPIHWRSKSILVTEQCILLQIHSIYWTSLYTIIAIFATLYNLKNIIELSLRIDIYWPATFSCTVL